MRKVHRELTNWIKDEYGSQLELVDVINGRHVTLHLKHKATGTDRKVVMAGHKNYADTHSVLNFKSDIKRWVRCLET